MILKIASKYWSDPWQYADVTPAGIITRIRITQIFHSLQNDDLNQLFDSFASGNGSSVRKNILRSATLNLDVAIEEFERFGMDPIIVEKMPIAEMAAVLRLMVGCSNSSIYLFFCLNPQTVYL